MKIYIMTDLEGVAGVLDFENWCCPSSRYYELAKEFLTREVNAAVDGFFAAGATEVVVSDGHGYGGISPAILDPRAEVLRGWHGYPLELDKSFFAAAWIGQHAKAGTTQAHIAHTGWFNVLNKTINGVSVGEFGEVALCANELGVRTIFGSGDVAFTREAQALFPGVETAAVKRGTQPDPGHGLQTDAYSRHNLAAIHKSPTVAREMIREGTRKALTRAQSEDFGLIDFPGPYEMVTVYRADGEEPSKTVKATHATSVAELLNTGWGK
jgi:D-amino peptidase